MPRKAPRSGPAVPPQDQTETRARRDRRHADDPVSLGLRKLWEQVEQEPVPDAFLALLDAIDTARSTGPATADSASPPPGDDPGKDSPS